MSWTEKGQADLTRLESELESIELEISAKETELMEIVPDWEDKIREENDAKDKLEASETTLKTLYDKQGRTAQFKTQNQRDAHLNSEIVSNKSLLGDRERQESEDRRGLEMAKASLEEATEKSRNLRKEIEGRKSLIETLTKETAGLKDEQQILVENRKWVF